MATQDTKNCYGGLNEVINTLIFPWFSNLTSVLMFLLSDVKRLFSPRKFSPKKLLIAVCGDGTVDHEIYRIESCYTWLEKSMRGQIYERILSRT